MPDEGWGSDAVDSSAPANRHMKAPAPVDPAVLAERAAAKKAKEERKRAAQKAKREEAKLKKKAAAEERKAAEASARKHKKDLEQAGKRGKALCGKLRGALASRDAKMMWLALADAQRFEDQFGSSEVSSVAQEVEAVVKLRVEVKAAYTTLALEAITEMTPLLDASEDDLGAVASAVLRYAAFAEDSTVEAIRGVLLTKLDVVKTALREAIAAAEGRPASFAQLNATIEKYAGHARILSAEIRDAKAAKSTLLSQCARELGGLAYASTKKSNTVTVAQIEKKLTLYDGYPEEGSIGESMAKLRPLLVTKRKEEEAKAKAIAAQKAKEAALKAKQERAEQQAKEEADFWAKHEQETIEQQVQQDRQWAEAAAAAEAVKAAEEAERQEQERIAAAIAAAQAEEAAKNSKALSAEEKEARKAAKKARQAEEKAKAQEEKKKKLQTATAEAAAAAQVLEAARIPSVLKTSPRFSPLREGGGDISLEQEDGGGAKAKQPKKVVWLDLDEQAAEEKERKKAEKKREANRKKKEKKKKKEAEKKAAAAAAGAAADTNSEPSQPAEAAAATVDDADDDDHDANFVDVATDGYKDDYDAMEALD